MKLSANIAQAECSATQSPPSAQLLQALIQQSGMAKRTIKSRNKRREMKLP
jgi:hypothetical protein